MRGIHSRGRKASEHARARVREGVQRRRAQGLPVGGQRRLPKTRFECVICGKIFVDNNGKLNRVVCSSECQIKRLHWGRDNNRRKRFDPPDEAVVEMYRSGKSTTAIGKLYGFDPSRIRQILIRNNVSRRNISDYKLKTCKVEGCEEPVHLIYHTVQKKWHGTECEKHFKERRQKWSQKRWLKKRREKLTKKLILIN
jgi:hypothetical protein